MFTFMLCLHMSVQLEFMHSYEMPFNWCNANTKQENMVMTHYLITFKHIPYVVH